MKIARLSVLLAALVAVPALAQAIPGTAQLSWSAPTQATDGSALVGPQALTKYQVFVSQSSISDSSTMAPTAEVPASSSAYTWTGNVVAGSSIFARVKACNAAGCSAFSAQGSKQFVISVPGTPGTVTVTVTLTIQAGP